MEDHAGGSADAHGQPRSIGGDEVVGTCAVGHADPGEVEEPCPHEIADELYALRWRTRSTLRGYLEFVRGGQ